MRLKLYIASKLHHAERWKDLNAEWDYEFDFVMRWAFHHVGTIPNEPVYAKVFWQQDVEDIQLADVVLVYALGDEKLCGALVEAGIGIALGKIVIVVGSRDHPDYGTWTYHPNVSYVPDLDSARILLKCLSI